MNVRAVSPIPRGFRLVPWIAGLVLAGSPLPAAAQSAASSAEARAAQFVFVIDDSGSMEKTDPDRLAVFAARSLVSMLDDRDEVSIVRLNGPREAFPPPPIEPLRQNRPRMEALLALNGEIAGYKAQNTPCRSALQGVKRLLADAQRSGVAQVVMLLTDGACTPADEQPAAEEILRGLESHDKGLFQFYLLRFQGTTYSQALVRLAEATGGKAIEADPGDPTSILHTFAAALSRSQGYEAYLLSPTSTHLAAHRGAERVRLLAIAPKEGPELSFILRNPRGGAPQALGRPRAGTHQYGSGRVYRYAALDYKPDAEPVEVAVQGAGQTWKVVALPEYRLAVRSAVHLGSCESPGAAVSSVDVGAAVCVVTELVNAQGQVVGGEVTGGDLTARVRARRPGGAAGEVELPANQLAGGEARFGLPRSNLERGDYELEPRVVLRLSNGDTVTLRGVPLLLEASSVVIKPNPERFSIDTLRPGSVAQDTLRLTGSFKPAPARVELRDRAALPACVTAEVNGVAEGKPLRINVDQPYNLALRVSPYCGPRPIRTRFDTAVRLVFDAEGGRQLPTVEIPVQLNLDYQIAVPPELVVKVRGGDAADLPLTVQGSFQREVKLRAVVAPPAESESWPEDRDDLVLGFAGDRRKRVLHDEEDEPSRVHDFAAGPGAPPLLLRALPGRCCAGGSYRTRLGLAPAADQPLPPGASPPEPLVVPVRIDVEPAGFWACWGPVVLAVLAVLALLLLALYVFNMFRNSSFLKAETLASRLKPLVWTEYGDAVEQKSSKNEVLRLVRGAMPPHRRALAWLKANPLRFGLPGGRYRETAELLLQAHRDVARSQIVLQADGDVQSRAESEPEGYVGRLFAVGAGKVTFLAVPDPAGRVNRLVWQDGYLPVATDGEPARLKAVKLNRARLLKALEPWETHDEGKPAGWQVG